MKASFKNLSVQLTLKGDAQAVDLTNEIAEAVYQGAANLEEHKLAHRIAESEEVELTDKDVATISRCIGQWRFIYQKPVLEALGVPLE